ncbi:MAG TPA: glycerophosphodiester phosphodiesterase [Gemmatimonadales bacterium]|nr:glycerophosphodiester phosphodiesterase [Gemmatimonadales bacterium]
MAFPQIIAHRGASGHAYENSLSSFALAKQLRAEGVELDIHSTLDGVFLVHHDPVVPGVGVIGTLPHDAFLAHRLPNGEPIPTLGQVLEELGAFQIWIEVKTLAPQWDARLLQLMKAGPSPERYAVHGFDHRIIGRLGAQAPLLRRGILSASYPVDLLTPMATVGADPLWQEAALIDRAMVETLHSAGKHLIAWTANDPAEIARLTALGIDGICGNYPERIRDAREVGGR